MKPPSFLEKTSRSRVSLVPMDRLDDYAIAAYLSVGRYIAAHIHMEKFVGK